MRRRFGVAFALLCIFSACETSAPPVPAADVVLVNGKIVTVDKDFSLKQGVAIAGGKFVAVGTNDEVRRRAGASTKVIDLGGRTVLPGLIDSHSHVVRGGLTYDAELHWTRVPSLKVGLEEIAQTARAQPKGTWIRVLGGWHESQLAEKRLPTRAELDQAAPDHPVWVQRLSSQVVLNGAAVKALGLTSTTVDPPGGRITKDEQGQPTGIANVGGINFYYPNVARLSPEQMVESTKHWFTTLNRAGLTAAIDAGGGLQRWPEDYAALNTLHDRGQQTLRVRWFMHPQRAGRELEDVRQFISIVKPGSGDDVLRPLGVGEAVLAATNDGTQWGAESPTFPAQAVDLFGQVLKVTLDAGWSVQLHTARNKSLEQLLPKFEELDKQSSLRDRHLGFAHIEDLSPQLMERIKALGAGVTVQDRLVYSGDDILRSWTPQMVRRAPPVQSMLKAGLVVGGGTDSTQVAPYEPFLSLWWLVTGKTIDGRTVRGPEELLTREQALRTYTTGSAWFSNDQEKLGSIEAGKLADLIVLSGDYLSGPEDSIKSLESLLTIVGGKPVYAAGDFASLAPRP